MASTLVTVLGLDENSYSQHSKNLLEHDFEISFGNVSDLKISDIYIVSLDLLTECSGQFNTLNISKPYLIAGDASLPSTGKDREFLFNSVGVVASNPSFHDLILNIELGLSWHDERLKYGRRLDDFEKKVENNRIIGVAVGMIMGCTHVSTYDEAFECLRIASRNKQRRISDVAVEITTKMAPEKQEGRLPLNCIKNLGKWLENNVTHRDDV